jgi:hypothetical protein
VKQHIQQASCGACPGRLVRRRTAKKINRRTKVSKNILDASFRVFPRTRWSMATLFLPRPESSSNRVLRYLATPLNGGDHNNVGARPWTLWIIPCSSLSLSLCTWCEKTSRCCRETGTHWDLARRRRRSRRRCRRHHSSENLERHKVSQTVGKGLC